MVEPDCRERPRRVSAAQVELARASALTEGLRPNGEVTMSREPAAGTPETYLLYEQPLYNRPPSVLACRRTGCSRQPGIEQAVKIFGYELTTLRELSTKVRGVMAGVEGVVDLNIEAQAEIPMLRIQFNQHVLSRHGMSAGQAADAVEMAFSGKRVSQVLVGQVPIDMVLRYDHAARRDLDAVGNALISTPLGPKVPLHTLAALREDWGPNYVGREAVQRRIVVSCNVAERSLVDVVNEIQQRVARAVQFPRGYRVEYGGQFESAASASRILVVLGVACSS